MIVNLMRLADFVINWFWICVFWIFKPFLSLLLFTFGVCDIVIVLCWKFEWLFCEFDYKSDWWHAPKVVLIVFWLGKDLLISSSTWFSYSLSFDSLGSAIDSDWNVLLLFVSDRLSFNTLDHHNPKNAI